jgi:protein-S-isoprenylcysteine O-methyltransferase Ste14
MTPVISHDIVLLSILANVVVRWPYEKRRRTNRIVLSQQDWQENIVLSLSFVGMVVLPALTVLTKLLRFARLPFRPGLAWIGVIVAAVALWLFRRSHADLGRHWSPTLVIHHEQNLVDTGVYRWIRHPMYSALLLLSLAQALLFNDNWLTGLAGLATVGLMYVVRVDCEEKMMVDRFGDRYREYMARTARIIPRVPRTVPSLEPVNRNVIRPGCVIGPPDTRPSP